MAYSLPRGPAAGAAARPACGLPAGEPIQVNPTHPQARRHTPALPAPCPPPAPTIPDDGTLTSPRAGWLSTRAVCDFGPPPRALVRPTPVVDDCPPRGNHPRAGTPRDQWSWRRDTGRVLPSPKGCPPSPTGPSPSHPWVSPPCASRICAVVGATGGAHPRCAPSWHGHQRRSLKRCAHSAASVHALSRGAVQTARLQSVHARRVAKLGNSAHTI